jgi:short subunit dehydrogenase-like uncharacterized protein
MTQKIILFGATGYTGHLVAQALVNRQLYPILCGRNKEKLDRLSRQLGTLETAIADVNDETVLAGLLSKGDILISTVGPFVQYGHTAVRAAVRKGAVYIDSTGEPAFIQEVFETFGPEAQSTGATLIPACGYDYVPGNCAAGITLNTSGPKAVRIDIGYYSKKEGRIAALDMSQGTQASLRMAMVTPSKVWQAGRLITETGGIRVRRFYIDSVPQAALTISSSEHFSLPKLFPSLQDINVYLGWFAKRTYTMQRAAILQSVLLKLPGYRSLASGILSMLPASKGKGPNARQRKENISHIIAEAFDAKDQLVACTELIGVDGYTFTANIIAWAAHMACLGKVLKTGATGPLEAFGLEALREGCEHSGLQVRVNPEAA